jgi:hypothetical protein
MIANPKARLKVARRLAVAHPFSVEEIYSALTQLEDDKPLTAVILDFAACANLSISSVSRLVRDVRSAKNSKKPRKNAG